MACSPGGQLYSALANCINTCTCGVDINVWQPAIAYCHEHFKINATAEAQCMCITARCLVDCIDQTACPTSNGTYVECQLTEAVMPGCSLDCGRYQTGGRLLAGIQCVTDIIEVTPAPTPAEIQTEKGGSETAVYVGVGIGSLVFIIIVAMCAYTLWSMKGRRAALENSMGAVSNGPRSAARA
mmetsp:Transcript_43000/g.68765  ORF Transcript_43000/g.68765 Transcript_43000/m.68765 type:complete len:183 (+) Transcript_43000:64-612(+)